MPTVLSVDGYDVRMFRTIISPRMVTFFHEDVKQSSI